MPELWDQLAQQGAEPVSLWPNGDRAPLRITVGGPTMKDGAQAPGYSLDPFNPPPVEYVGRPIAEKLASLFSGPSWLQRATEQTEKDKAAFQAGGVPALMADTAAGQELAGGFGGTTVGKLAPALMEAPVVASPFYSAAQRAVENAKLGKGTGEQWLGYLRNQPGVKPEELQYVFGNLPEGQLTKAQMQAHAAENEVKLGEVNKSNIVEAPGFGTAQEQSAAIRRLDEARQAMTNSRPGTPQWDAVVQEHRAAEGAMRDIVPGWGRSAGTIQNPTKYEQWQLPGGENYRETLLTLPQKGREEGAVAANFARQMREKYGERWSTSLSPEESAQYNSAISAQEKAEAGSIFNSSHWDEPNVLAHVRTNDREIPGVGKSLHVEEIQSDWHQKGRQHGYAGEPNKQIDTEYKAWLNENNLPQKSMKDMLDDDSLPRAKWDAVMGFQRRSEEAQAIGGNIPDAPFKSTWADVALKRQIREAAEKGYDAISWTPGKAQADRYKLSNQLKELQYLKNEDGTYEIAGTTISGDGFNHPGRVTADKLSDVVGKEMAQKIVNNEGKRTRGQNYDGGYFDGIQLDVGGEGMKGFYDKMLVDKANAIGKKHGARVEQSEVSGHQYKGYQSYHEGEGPTGAPAIFGVDSNGTSRLIRQNFNNYEEAIEAAAELNKGGKKEPVHVLRITPELRAAAMKGFPLFSLGAGGAVLAPGLFNNAGPAPNMWGNQ